MSFTRDVCCCWNNIKNIKTFYLQQIMKDRWINAGHEDDELKPFVEPELDIADQKRIGNQ